MTDQELKDLVASLAVSQDRTDEQLDRLTKKLDKVGTIVENISNNQGDVAVEYDENFDKLTKKLEKLGVYVGNVANNQGNVAEEYFVNSLKKYLNIGKLNFDYLIPNFKATNGKNVLAEYDILLVNGESVAIVEVKYKAHINDLEKLAKKTQSIKNLPQYKNYKVYAGVATFYANDELIKKAKELGYFILQRDGDVVITHSENLKVA